MSHSEFGAGGFSATLAGHPPRCSYRYKQHCLAFTRTLGIWRQVLALAQQVLSLSYLSLSLSLALALEPSKLRFLSNNTLGFGVYFLICFVDVFICLLLLIKQQNKIQKKTWAYQKTKSSSMSHQTGAHLFSLTCFHSKYNCMETLSTVLNRRVSFHVSLQ